MTKSSSSSSSSLSTDTYDYESCDYIPNHSPNSAVAPVSSKRVEENGDERCKSKFSDYTPPLALRSIEIYDIFVYNGKEVKQIVSIPNDENTTLLEFMMDNPKHIQRAFSLTAMTKAYKIYIIDRTYAQGVKKCDIMV